MNDMVNKNDVKLILEQQKRLFMSAVSSVDGFNEELLKLTVNGKKVIVKGRNIKITQFNKDNGNLTADGEFLQIIFSGENVSLVKKLFK